LDEDSGINITGKSYHMTPSKTVSRSPNFGTIASDHAVVLLNEDTQIATFTFFQTHMPAKLDEKGIVPDSIEEEMVLEVKMPFNTAFALALFMNNAVKEFRSKPYQHRFIYGPVFVKDELKPKPEGNKP
jgi:hypothetical protein